MFNIGPMELIVLGLVAIIVFGPERLPQLARDAAALIRSLREVAQGARTQLREELGPEFADVDLRNLNPKTAIRRALLGDDFEIGSANPRNALLDAFTGEKTESESVGSQINGAVRDAVGTGVSVNPKQAIKDALLGPPTAAKPAAAANGNAANGTAVSISKDAPSTAEPKPYVGDFDAT